MKLSEKETELFFQLMWALQFYVNGRLGIHPGIQSLDAYIDLDPAEKQKVRDALHADPSLIHAFTLENPHGFSREQLGIVDGWKNAVRGNFIIERLLKKYAVFIKEDTVYGVIGISQGFDEFFHQTDLPIMVETALLPFNGKIIYDGMFSYHSIRFGAGTRKRLKETYSRARQNQRILLSMDAEPRDKPEKKSVATVKDWGPELEELAMKAQLLKGSSGHPAICTPAFSLVKASIEFARIAASNSGGREDLHEALQKVRRAFNRSSTVLYYDD
ncbi:MAG: hypothetical protein V1793_11645 [Pseudomonadota bacterium]